MCQAENQVVLYTKTSAISINLKGPEAKIKEIPRMCTTSNAAFFFHSRTTYISRKITNGSLNGVNLLGFIEQDIREVFLLVDMMTEKSVNVGECEYVGYNLVKGYSSSKQMLSSSGGYFRILNLVNRKQVKKLSFFSTLGLDKKFARLSMMQVAQIENLLFDVEICRLHLATGALTTELIPGKLTSQVIWQDHLGVVLTCFVEDESEDKVERFLYQIRDTKLVQYTIIQHTQVISVYWITTIFCMFITVQAFA
jgi:hypothetical protein